METIHRSELYRLVKLNEIEAFTPEQLKIFAEENLKDIEISKGNRDDLMKSVVDEIKSFVPFKVADADAEGHLVYSTMMIRKAQIDWDLPGDDISKSRSGTYLNTAENRKAARVGQQYGEKGLKAD